MSRLTLFLFIASMCCLAFSIYCFCGNIHTHRHTHKHRGRMNMEQTEVNFSSKTVELTSAPNPSFKTVPNALHTHCTHYPLQHTHTHARAHAHTHVYTHTHACTRTRTHTHKHTQKCLWDLDHKAQGSEVPECRVVYNLQTTIGQHFSIIDQKLFSSSVKLLSPFDNDLHL